MWLNLQESSKSAEESADSGSAVHSLSSRGEGSRLEPESPHVQLPQQVEMASASNSPRTGVSQPQPLAKPTSEKDQKVSTLLFFTTFVGSTQLNSNSSIL